MSLGTDFHKAFQEGFANRDSSRLAELITDDFQMITPLRSLSGQEALAWVGAGGGPTSLGDREIAYENGDIAVYYANTNTGDKQDNAVSSRTRCVARKKDGKIYECIVAISGEPI